MTHKTHPILYPFLALSLFLSGCSPQTVSPLPTFGKAIVPEWIQANFDNKVGDELIATSNLQDIVFDSKGEVIGWYIKPNAGTPFIHKKEDGSYDFSALQNGNGGIVNMVGNHPSFAVEIPSFNKENIVIEKPIFSQDDALNTQTAIFSYTDGNITVKKIITLNQRNFKIDLKTSVTGVDSAEIAFHGLGKDNNPHMQAVPVGSAQPISVTGMATATVNNAQYVALQEQPSQIAHALIVRPLDGDAMNATLTGSQGLFKVQVPAQSHLEVYGGKNELIHLYQSGYSTLPALFKPNFFGQISLWLVKLMEFMYRFIGDWGMVIVVLTVLLRLAMWPLMQAQGRSTAKMQLIQPKLQEIQERYKDRKDLESQNAMRLETMELYKQHNVNPAGCLSGFLPFPILIAMWSTIRNFEFDKGFLWLPDLAIPDPLYILALLYLVVNIGNLFVMTRKTPEMFKQQAMMYIFFLYFAFTFPAGVIIYSILSTLIGIVQQIIINKQVEKEAETSGVVISTPTTTSVVKTKKTKVIDQEKD